MAIQILKRPFRYCFSGNSIYYQLYSALAASDADVYFEYRIKYHTIGAAYSTTKEFPYSPVDGYANIDIKDILDSLLEYELPIFPGDEKTIHSALKQTSHYF